MERKGKCQSLSQLMVIILKITTLPTSRSGNYTEISNGTQYQILDLKKKPSIYMPIICLANTQDPV